MTSLTTFLPSMGQVSNRTILAQLEKWGWDIDKVKGDDTYVSTPSGLKAVVRSAHSHQGNNKHTLKEICDLMGLSWEEFIAPIPPETQQAIKVLKTVDQDEVENLIDRVDKAFDRAEEAEKQRQREQQAELRKKRREERKAKRDHPVTITQIPKETAVSAPAAPEAELPVPTFTEAKKRVRGVSNDVFDVLVQTDEPMSVDRLCEALTTYKRTQISGACSYLVQLNVATRIKQGVYRIRDEVRRGADYRVGIDVTAKTEAPGGVQEASTPVAVPRDEKPADVVLTDGSTDDIVIEMLDLMLPNGYKARHLRLIDTWRAATVALLKEVGSDGLL